MPSSCSLLRSSLNYNSGATTRFAGVFCGIFCAIGAVILGVTAAITFVPKCVLAALMIGVAVTLIHPHYFRICLRTTRSDAIVLLVTLVAALITPLHVAIFFGAAVSIMAYLNKVSKPVLVEFEPHADEEVDTHPFMSIIHVEGELFFGASELFRSEIQRICSCPNLRVVVLRLRGARSLDATTMIALEDLYEALKNKSKHLVISGATKEVSRVLRRSGVIRVVGVENVFLHNPESRNECYALATKRAREVLGSEQVEVRVYIDADQPNG